MAGELVFAVENPGEPLVVAFVRELLKDELLLSKEEMSGELVNVGFFGVLPKEAVLLPTMANSVEVFNAAFINDAP